MKTNKVKNYIPILIIYLILLLCMIFNVNGNGFASMGTDELLNAFFGFSIVPIMLMLNYWIGTKRNLIKDIILYLKDFFDIK